MNGRATQPIGVATPMLAPTPHGETLQSSLRVVTAGRAGALDFIPVEAADLSPDAWEYGASIRLYFGLDEVQDFAVIGTARSTGAMVRCLFDIPDDQLVVGERLHDGLGETLNQLVGRVKHAAQANERFAPRLDTPEVLERGAAEVYARVRPNAALYRVTSDRWCSDVVFLVTPRRRLVLAAMEQATQMLMRFGMDRELMTRACRLLEEVRGPVLALTDLPAMGITVTWCIEKLAVLVNGLGGFRERALFHRVVRELDSLRGTLENLTAPKDATAFVLPEEDDLRLLLGDFCIEANRALAEAEAALSGPDDDELVHTLFRIMHGVRGNAAFFELDQVQRLCHATQSLVGSVRDGSGRLSEEQVDAVRHAVVLIGDWVRVLEHALEGAGVVDWNSDLEAHIRMLEHVLECGGRIAIPTVGDLAGAATPGPHDHLRLDEAQLQRLESIRSELERWARAADADAERREALERASTQLAAICRSVRRVPMANVLGRLARHCRDVAERHGRLVRVDVSGEAITAPEHLATALTGALAHLVDNAIEHGIEEAAERQALGKKILASVALRVSRTREQFTLEVYDDGRGIQRHAVLARARALGLATDTTALVDALDLVFEPGLSTSTPDARISGDGLGLDVVRREVEALGGSVLLTSDPGAGTRVRLVLPEHADAASPAEAQDPAPSEESLELEADGTLNFL